MHIVHKGAGKRRNLIPRAGLRRAVTVGGTLFGAAIVTAAFSLPAGATVTAPAKTPVPVQVPPATVTAPLFTP